MITVVWRGARDTLVVSLTGRAFVSTKSNILCIYTNIHIIRPRRSRSAAAYSRQTFPWTICRSVRRCIGRSVCPVHCGKTADRIRMPFGIEGRTGPGMRQVVGFGDQSTERGTFGGEFVARHCNQWGLYGVRVRQRRGPLPKLLWAYLFPLVQECTCCSRKQSITNLVIFCLSVSALRTCQS